MRQIGSVTSTEYWIKETLPGNARVTFAQPGGDAQYVSVRHNKIGPFVSIPEAADYLAVFGALHASYEIETVTRVHATP